MSTDVYLTDEGDITVSQSGDILLVPDRFRSYSQQAYIRMMTAIGDFDLYPLLGADLEELTGMPNNPETAEYGKKLILSSLDRENVFAGMPIDVKAVPVSHFSVRFDIYMTIGSRSQMILSIEQNLTVALEA